MSIYLGNKTIVNSDMQGPCPDGFHVPLKDDWEAAINVLTALGGNQNNVVSCFKLPKAGYMRYNLSRSYKDQYGFYWTSSASGNTTAYHLMFTSSNVVVSSGWTSKTSGVAIRPFKNEPVIPTSSWTKLFGTSIAAGGIFWSASDELISLSSNGTTWYTMSDKNLGATSVYNDGDGTSDDKCGYFYEWGNNYGFGWSDTIQSSSSGVNAQNYGPGNYYSSSTFITSVPRDTSNNANLRGGVTQGTSTITVPAEIKNLYIGANEVKEVYVGADKVRGETIINFATQGPCADGFHVPLTTEWNDLYNLLRAVGTLNITNFNTRLKIPNMGYRRKSDGSLVSQGTEPDYWSSSCKDNGSGYFFSYSGGRFYPQNSWDTGYGFAVRAFKNEAAVPDSSWTVIYENGVKKICHSSSLGLISISSDGTNWTTIADKNVGATTVWNYGDTLSASNCGGYFQQGNNYMFPYSGSVTTSSNQVNASTYGPGNYYSSSTFITNSNKTWDSSVNKNLRGGVDGNVPV